MVLEKLSNLKVISEYGQTVGVDLSALLLSPFPDYDAFLASISILSNHDDIQIAIKDLLILGTEEWYKQFVPLDGSWSDTTDVMSLANSLRMYVIRRVQSIRVPSPDMVAAAIQETF